MMKYYNSMNMMFTNGSQELLERESVEIEELFEGRVVKVVVAGKLTRDSFNCFTPDLDGLIETHGTIRLIFEMIHFEGLTMGAAWEDLKFGCKHFNQIERIAFVGDKEWEKTMVDVFKPFARENVRYFDVAEVETATNWITEDLWVGSATKK